MIKFYVHHNGSVWLVKESKAFSAWGGLTEPWGRDWRPIESTTAETVHAVVSLTWKSGTYLIEVKSDWIGADAKPAAPVWPRHLELSMACMLLEDASKSLSIEDRHVIAHLIRTMNHTHRVLSKPKGIKT